MTDLGRKLIVMLSVAVLVVFNELIGAPISLETLEAFFKFVVAPFLIAQGYADASAGGSTRLAFQAAREIQKGVKK